MYENILKDFKKGWLYFLSSLETSIIESKLRFILQSFTFKYSRMPHYLRLIPERITEINLRICERIKMMQDEALTKEEEKFFEILKAETADPHREEKS